MWESGLKIVNCENFCDKSYRLYVLPKVSQKIGVLMRKFPNIEWNAYLKGNIVHSKKMVYVYDLILPLSQYNTVGNVDEIEMDLTHSYIGVVHSHHTMGAFFSGPDDATVNKNHTVSIVVSTNKGNEIAAVVRGNTTCGSLVMDENPEIFRSNVSTRLIDVDAFEKEIDVKIPKVRPANAVSRFKKHTPPARVVHDYTKQGYRGVGYEYGLPAYYGNDVPPTDDFDTEKWVEEFMGNFNKTKTNESKTETSKLDIAELFKQIKVNESFRQMVFKELINDKGLLKHFKDVIIHNMIKKGVLGKKGNTYSPANAKRMIQKMKGKILH